MPPDRVLCLRHAEEPADPLGKGGPGFDGHAICKHSLTARGWQRAGALAATKLCHLLEGTHPHRLKVLVPDYDGEPERHRAYQTVLPLSLRYGVTIEHDFNKDEVPKLTHTVMRRDGVVVICWQHEFLTEFARQLVGEETLEWPSSRYDLIWDMRPTDSGQRFTCNRIDQRLLSSDRGVKDSR